MCRYKRLSPLVPLNSSLGGQFKSIRSGDCVVVFSREKLFRVRRKIETATKKACAIIYGGLPSGKFSPTPVYATLVFSPMLHLWSVPGYTCVQSQASFPQSPTRNASFSILSPRYIARLPFSTTATMLTQSLATRLPSAGLLSTFSCDFLSVVVSLVVSLYSNKSTAG